MRSTKIGYWWVNFVLLTSSPPSLSHPHRLSVMTDSTMFATFSDDGSTKLWDVAKLEGRNIVNKAKLSYSQQGCYVLLNLCY